jgi:hypothetical protein
MEKYGFVYLWYDRKHKRYYIGCHWGYENDGYICSSSWMRNAFKRRPSDFKRRIISKIYSSRVDTINKEYEWLCLISENELGKKYYNLTKHKNGHWTTEEERFKTLSEKISHRTKEAMQRPEVREKYLKGLETRDTKSSNLETRQKRRISMMGKNKGKITVKDKDGNIFHTTKEDPRWINGELIAASKGIKRPPLSESRKQKIKDTAIFKDLNNKKIKCKYCDFIGNVGNIARYHNEKCKKRPI